MKQRWILEEKIFQPLGKEEQKFLHLIRSAVIGVDNLVDEEGYSHKYLLRITKLVKDTWNKKKFKSQNKYENQFISAINILRKLFDNEFYQAKQIYKDFSRGYDSEYKWASNRNKILNSKTIQELNINIGAEVVTIFLYFQIPKSKYKDLKISKRLVQKYGLAIKSADNLASLYKDILEGFITIPKENINKVSGLTIKNDKLIAVNKKNLKIDKKYIRKLTKETKSIYQKASQLLDKNRQRLGLTKQQAELFKKWAYTWLEDTKIKI